MANLYKSRLLFVFLLAVAVASCRKDEHSALQPNSPGKVSEASDRNIFSAHSSATRSYSGSQLQAYFTLMCKISKATKGFFPPQVARAYGYVGITAYESVVHGIPGGISLYRQVNGLTPIPEPNPELKYNWGISSSAAVADMMRDMYKINISTANAKTIDSLEAANLAALSLGVNQDVITRSVQYGKDVTAAIYNASTTDGADQSYLNPFQLPYTPPVGPQYWIPTSATLTPVAPYWGNNRALIEADKSIRPEKPTEFDTSSKSKFYEHARQVYNQVKNNTAEEVAIAKFWADDPFNTCTPTGHTFNIMIQLLKENNATLEKASVALAKLSIAENEAFICCWRGKYQYNTIRPVSYIKEYIDPAFTTVIGTPPFPSYTSGHSSEIAAGVKIFTDMFTNGSGRYDFTDYSQLQYGFPARNYTNFNQMANECANSRFYAGIHFKQDNDEGLRLGSEIGENVLRRIAWPFTTR